MPVYAVPVGLDNYAWVAQHPSGGRAVVIDPGEAGPVLEFLRARNMKCAYVLVTHHHADHTSGVARLKHETGAASAGPGGGCAEHIVTDNEILASGSLEIIPLFTPGHTACDVSCFAPSVNAIFTGDIMFAGGCGRLFGPGPGTMWNSLNRIASLGDDVLVCCGHEYTLENLRFAHSVEPANIAVLERLKEVEKLRKQGLPTVPSPVKLEKNTNPFLRASDPAMKSVLGMEGETDVNVFAALRAMKDRF